MMILPLAVGDSASGFDEAVSLDFWRTTDQTRSDLLQLPPARILQRDDQWG